MHFPITQYLIIDSTAVLDTPTQPIQPEARDLRYPLHCTCTQTLTWITWPFFVHSSPSPSALKSTSLDPWTPSAFNLSLRQCASSDLYACPPTTLVYCTYADIIFSPHKHIADLISHTVANKSMDRTRLLIAKCGSYHV